MKWLKNFLATKSSVDEFSLFLIGFAFVASIFLMILRLNGYIIFTWIFILLGYWRIFSKNRIAREKENQVFLKVFYPVKSFFVRWYRKFTIKDDYKYFDCESCSSQLRIPRSAKNVKVTCPKCKHSFIKRTMMGKMENLIKQGKKKSE